ncbi:Condensation multi-domain protein, partial [Pyrenophora tritici-repentis]
QGQKRQPSTEAQRTMQQLWARALSIEPASIGLDDSFFQLGGDSIVAMQISWAARKAHLQVSSHDIMDKHTIGRLVAHMGLSSSLHPVIDMKETVDFPFGLTPIQQLYLHLENTGTAVFQQSFMLKLTTPVGFSSLHVALRSLVRRHSMLRARFSQAAPGKWQQYISAVADQAFAATHLPSKDIHDAEEAIRQSWSLLDIQSGPVLSAVLFGEGEQQSLFITAHHLVIDLVSWRVLLEELEDLLLSRPLLPMSSMPFSKWQAIQAEQVVSQ